MYCIILIEFEWESAPLIHSLTSLRNTAPMSASTSSPSRPKNTLIKLCPTSPARSKINSRKPVGPLTKNLMPKKIQSKVNTIRPSAPSSNLARTPLKMRNTPKIRANNNYWDTIALSNNSANSRLPRTTK